MSKLLALADAEVILVGTKAPLNALLQAYDGRDVLIAGTPVINTTHSAEPQVRTVPKWVVVNSGPPVNSSDWKIFQYKL